MIQPMHPFVVFLRDLWLHAKGLLCIIRRRHDSLEPIGHLTKKGFGPIPMFQCRRCAGIWIRESGARRLGARRG
jgi:hypothetical protein